MEIAGRAGGLVPTNRLALRDIVLYGGADRSELDRYDLERDPTVAHRILDAAPIADGDLFVVISSSGVNGVVVELAAQVKERGHDLIAITSLAHSAAAPARHPSGRRLCDLADVVLDNRAPYGDAVLPLPGGGAVAAVSTITSALLAQLVVIGAVAELLAAGQTPPVYLSANVPEGTRTTSPWRPGTRAASAGAAERRGLARSLRHIRRRHVRSTEDMSAEDAAGEDAAGEGLVSPHHGTGDDPLRPAGHPAAGSLHAPDITRGPPRRAIEHLGGRSEGDPPMPRTP
nr:hypothetical protein GCM10020093_071140 [Planobispora longispora]